MRESKIEKHLAKRVEELGGECRKLRWIGRRGAPDRLVMLPEAYANLEGHPNPFAFVRIRRSLTVWVELKAPGEKPEPHQAREHERMRRMGQRVEVIDSIEGVEELLR